MELTTFIGIHVAVPFIGAIAFATLCRRMRKSGVQSPPIFPYLILFSAIGGWLLIFLTALFWRWSGMASLGVVYLLLIVPILTAVAAFRLRMHRVLSAFHQTAFVASIAYSLTVTTGLLVLLGSRA